MTTKPLFATAVEAAVSAATARIQTAIATSVKDVAKSGVMCPACESFSTMVNDSRQGKGFIRRRRVCAECGTRWNTVEIPEDQFLTLIKLPVHWAKKSKNNNPRFIGKYIVPPEKQAEVLKLRNKGLNMTHIAELLGLALRNPSKGTDDG
jgi:transcription repressor NrdR-like protein